MTVFTPASVSLPASVRTFLDSSPAADLRGTGEQHTSVFPFTGERLFTFSNATAGDVDRAVNDARAAQPEWGNATLAARSAVLLRLHDLVMEHEEAVLDLIQAENGKSRSHAYDELMDIYNCCRFYAVNAQKAYGTERHKGALPVLTKTRTQYYPLGLVGLISPWNYPLSLGVGDVLAALIAGNAVVHKPDSQTSLTAIYLRRLAIQAGLPAGVWQLVPGRGAEVGDALIERVDGLSFTGSTRVGKEMASQAAARLLPTMAELGGKNPMLVLEDADVDYAAEGAVRACFSSSGQLCMSAERIYVHSAIADEFIAAFARATKRQVVGPAFSDAATIGSLTGPAQLETVSSHVEDAVTKGATVITGGTALPESGPYFYEPTIITGATPEMKLYDSETFGPVVAVYVVDSAEEAIARANDSDFGLTASVWGKNTGRAWAVASRLEAGMVNINEAFAPAYGSISAPGGGVKDSGLNHRHGITGMRLWANKRTVSQQRFHPIAPSQHVSPSTFRAIVRTGMRAMKAMRM